MKVLIFLALSLTPINSFAQRTAAETAREELNLGVKAYRNANYDDAVQHFQRASLLDGTLCVAKLYLATTYAQQYVPGVDAKENLGRAGKAIQEYQQVAACKPDSVAAQKGIGYLNSQLKHWGAAREAYRQALRLDDKDPETFYAIGVLDWTEAYANSKQHEEDSKGSNALATQTACSELRELNLPLVEDGLQVLTRAVELRKEYDDAMAYLNLLYRLRAQIECENPDLSKADIRKAEQWVDLAMETRRTKIAAATNCSKGQNQGNCRK